VALVENNDIAVANRANENRMLVRLGQLTVEELKIAIGKTNLENKEEIKRSIKWKMLPGKILVYSDHPSFYLDQGVKPHQMRYVRNRVIPIDLKSLKAIPTARERRRGVAFRRLSDNPKHPGIDPLNFVADAMEKAQNRLAVEMLEKYIMVGS